MGGVKAEHSWWSLKHCYMQNLSGTKVLGEQRAQDSRGKNYRELKTIFLGILSVDHTICFKVSLGTEFGTLVLIKEVYFLKYVLWYPLYWNIKNLLNRMSSAKEMAIQYQLLYILLVLSGSGDFTLLRGYRMVYSHTLPSQRKECRCMPGVQWLPGKLAGASYAGLVFFSAV